MFSGRVTGMMRVAADSLTEQEATRQLLFAAGALTLLGVLLLVGTVLWWRSTRPEPPALAPLEVMSGRRWAHASEAERRRIADEVRPQGGQPAMDRPDPIPVDLARVVGEEPDRFLDLQELDELLGLTGVAVAQTSDSPADSLEPETPDVQVASESLVGDQIAAAELAAEPLPASELEVDEVSEGVDAAEAHDPENDDHEERPADGDDDATEMLAIDPLLRLSQPD